MTISRFLKIVPLIIFITLLYLLFHFDYAETDNKKSLCNEIFPEKFREDNELRPLFDEREHLELGKEANIGEVNLSSGKDPFTIPFEEIVQMADYFETFDQLKQDASNEKGRRKIGYLRWKFKKEKTKAYSKSKASTIDHDKEEPSITPEEKKEINDRYYRVTASNFSHFAPNDKAKKKYLYYHHEALNKTCQAGLFGEKKEDGLYQEALAIEAFGLHFFTDAFAAGHIRTPREEIKSWYDKNYLGSFDKFLEFLGDYMSAELFNQHSYILRLFGYTPSDFKGHAMEGIKKEAGSYPFSLGDILSIAIHDVEGCGLKVVSDFDSDGNIKPKGFYWKTIGDGLLSYNLDAKKHIENAVKASVKELEKAYSLGLNCNNKDSDSNCELHNSNHFNTSLGSIPKPDPSLKLFSEVYKWRWGGLNDETKKAIKASIKYNEEIFDQISDITNKLLPKCYAVVLCFNPKEPFKRFFECFREYPVEILERVFAKPAGSNGFIQTGGDFPAQCQKLLYDKTG